MTAVPWPNFFIVGVPRSGTTSLYHYLKQHPQVFISRIRSRGFLPSTASARMSPSRITNARR